MKNLKILGRTLSKVEQKIISGGLRLRDPEDSPGGNPCYFMQCLNSFGRCTSINCTFDDWIDAEYGV